MKLMGILLGLILVQSSFAFETDSTRREQAVVQAERLRLTRLEFNQNKETGNRAPASVSSDFSIVPNDEQKSLIPAADSNH
ncbi:MAG: hypothetical protein JST80_13580 [Bdellovibrionales bacterium]|nr:hypothetical protein [Bdellovibrionales bacterium]